MTSRDPFASLGVIFGPRNHPTADPTAEKLKGPKPPFCYYRHCWRLSAGYPPLPAVIPRCHGSSSVVWPLSWPCPPVIRHYRHSKYCLGVVGSRLRLECVSRTQIFARLRPSDHQRRYSLNPRNWSDRPHFPLGAVLICPSPCL